MLPSKRGNFVREMEKDMYLGVCRYGQQDSKISEYKNEKVVSKMGSNV